MVSFHFLNPSDSISGFAQISPESDLFPDLYNGTMFFSNFALPTPPGDDQEIDRMPAPPNRETNANIEVIDEDAVVELLKNAPRIFVEAIHADSEENFERFEKFWGDVCRKIQHGINFGLLSEETIGLSDRTGYKIACLSRAYQQLEIRAQQLKNNHDNWNDTEVDVYRNRPLSNLRSSSLKAENTKDDIEPWREWFLAHLSWPYPNAAERRKLLLAVPNFSCGQLSTWFTNARRRSGWSRLYRFCCLGNRKILDTTVISLKSGDDNASNIHPEAKDVFQTITRYMQPNNRVDKVSSWMHTLCADHMAMYKSGGKRIRTTSTPKNRFKRLVKSDTE